MDSFVLQDWTTVRGAANVTVTQGESGWLDLAPYEDVVFWLLVSQATTGGNIPTLLYQTSPSKDESFFAAQTLGMTGTGIQLAQSASPVVTPAFAWNTPFPLARYVRWQIIPASITFDATFRVVVSASAPRL